MKAISLSTLGILFLASVTFSQDLYPRFTYDKASDTLVWDKAWIFLESEQYLDALKTINKLGKPYREDAAVHWFKALCNQGLNKDDMAFRHIGLAIAYAPECYGLIAFRAELWQRQSNYKNEAADLAAYVMHDPDDSHFIDRYIAALEKINKTPQAIAFLEHRREKDLNFLNELARLYASISEYDSATSLLHQAINLAPTEEMSYINLAIIYQISGQSDKALHIADRVLLINSKSGRAFAVKSWVYGELDFEEESERYYYLASENGYLWDE
jgi:lipopolysaccharide biosynthesis regulator YciM